LQNLRGDNGGVEVMNCSPGFLRQRHFSPVPAKVRLGPPATAKAWRFGNVLLFLVTTVIPASLPEFFPSKVYVIHEMHSDDDFFIRHKHGRRNPPFCVIFTQNETSVFRRSPAAETGTVNVILTTASLPDFRAKIVQSLHKMTPPPPPNLSSQLKFMAAHSGRIQNGQVAATARNENGFGFCTKASRCA
jgi:hypothetical protein